MIVIKCLKERMEYNIGVDNFIHSTLEINIF